MVPVQLSHIKTRALVAIAVSLVLVIAAIALGTVMLSIWTGAPVVEEHQARETTVIYDAGGEVLADLYEEDRTWVEIDEIPPQMQQAFIAIEDRNFRNHRGVDLRAMLRAAVANIREGAIVEGGSTITQQLARNVYLGHARTFTRKLQEMRIALELERRYSKAEILEMYLNEIYLGSGTYGVKAAAERYFNKELDELDLHEIATLAALPRSPEFYSPHRNPEAAQNRRDLVLQTMSGLGYVTQHEADEAAGHELQVAEEPLEAEDIGHYFVKHVRNRLIERYGSQRVYTGGLQVHTTLDRDKQQAAEDAVEHAFETGLVPTREPSPDPYAADAGSDSRQLQPQPALVTVDTATGAVRAMVGGRGEDSLNRATQATRQPGSAFKPFIYAAAIRAGHHPGTVVNDLPVVFSDPDEPDAKLVWPINYDHRYRGLISYRDALAYSVNVAAVRTLAALGLEEVRQHIDRYGFSTLTEDDGGEGHYAFALGGLERGVSPLEMASAYGVFHDGFATPDNHTITKVETADGETIYERPDNTAEPAQVLSDAEAYLMRDMLRSVMDYGTGRHAAQEIPVAGKTGTTDRNTDGWFVGFADEMVTAVWLGEDSPAPMEYRIDDEGAAHRAPADPDLTLTGVHASQIWGEYSETILDAEDTELLDRHVLGNLVHDLEEHADAEFEAPAEADERGPEPGFELELEMDPDEVMPNRWERRRRPDDIIEVEIDPLTGLAPAEDAPQVEHELVIRENAPRLVSGFWGETETAEVDLRSNRLLNPACVYPIPEEQRYIADGRYRIGPARFYLGSGDRFVTSAGEPFSGIYEVGPYEPVQKIDAETRMPSDPSRITIERVPALPCLIPTESNGHEDHRIELLE